MNIILSINGKSGSTAQSVYSMSSLRKMAKALVGKQGKLHAVTINFDERTGSTRLIASYEAAPNQQTFASMAI